VDKSLIAAALALGLAAQVQAAGAVLTPLFAADHIAAPWHVAGLPRQSKPLTRFTVERVDERVALRVEADHSYGLLVHELPQVSAAGHLRWSWRLQQANTAVDLRKRGGDDTPARVCVSFDLPLDSVPFTERQLLRLARSTSGERLPAATLCYVWGHDEAHEAHIDNPYTRRLRYVVLRNVSDASGVWFDESRDIAADFKQSFSDESPQPPPLVAVGVGADSDNTGAHTVAHVTALRLEP
jgi:hypothetical protein